MLDSLMGCTAVPFIFGFSSEERVCIVDENEIGRLISMASLVAMLGLSRSTIYKMIKDGTFPKPIKIGARRIAWRIDAVDKWLTEREGIR